MGKCTVLITQLRYEVFIPQSTVVLSHPCSQVWTRVEGSGPVFTGQTREHGSEPMHTGGYMPVWIQRPGPVWRVLVDTSSQSVIRSWSVYRIAVYGPTLQHFGWE